MHACAHDVWWGTRTFGGGGNFEPIELVKDAVGMSGRRRTRTIVGREHAAITAITPFTEVNMDKAVKFYKLIINSSVSVKYRL